MATVLVLPQPASATSQAEFAAKLSQVASRVIAARIVKTLCDERDVAGEIARRDALSSWIHRNDIADYDAVISALERNSEGMRQEMAGNLERAGKQIATALDADGSACTDLKAFLAAEDYAVKPDVRQLKRLARDFSLDLTVAKPDTPAAPVKLMRLAQLSVVAEAEMASIGSFDGARKDRDLRQAREAHLEAHLARQGAVAAYGRVVDDDRLREWLGPRQSRFSLSCSSFRNDANEAKMKAALGEDMVVVGEPRTVSDGENARISLRNCQVFTLTETGETLVETADAAGLVHRSPEMEEVYAGAGRGIAMADVDRVLYVADFQNRLDGFGNGYTDRDEDIYVLLNDGTAYRHAWRFPFTDLDVAASKAREPGRWLSWSKGWSGKVTLTADGREVDISKAQALTPLRPGTLLDHNYYYLNVGMGGVRSDRTFSFKPDGSVTHARGGFVAGNFATSYMIVTSDRDDRATSTYRIEDYALVLSHPQGEERRFFATFESADGSDPDEVVIDGEVYWTRKPGD